MRVGQILLRKKRTIAAGRPPSRAPSFAIRIT